MRAHLSHHGLSLVFGGLMLLALVGQALTGQAAYNDDALSAGLQPISLVTYLGSASFAADVAENWQSEYLQFLLYIVLTVWLVERGSPESKDLGKVGLESDEDQLVGPFAKPESPAWAKAAGWRRSLYSTSLGLVMAVIFLACVLAQFVAGRSAFNEEQLNRLEAPLDWSQYLGSPDFWNRMLQNWQSEFLAVGSMVVLSIYLRQRGSPESKPVGAAHAATGLEG
ncbi:MAG TPA: DUF6766 family protein [Dermatophilaceae bacterium]|nr:DUF6766 family protein [Dermatophilaceae bacterium]